MNDRDSYYLTFLKVSQSSANSLCICFLELPIISFFGYVYVRKFEFSYIFGRKHKPKNEIIGSPTKADA